MRREGKRGKSERERENNGNELRRIETKREGQRVGEKNNE